MQYRCCFLLNLQAARPLRTSDASCLKATATAEAGHDQRLLIICQWAMLRRLQSSRIKTTFTYISSLQKIRQQAPVFGVACQASEAPALVRTSTVKMTGKSKTPSTSRHRLRIRARNSSVQISAALYAFNNRQHFFVTRGNNTAASSCNIPLKRVELI